MSALEDRVRSMNLKQAIEGAKQSESHKKPMNNWLGSIVGQHHHWVIDLQNSNGSKVTLCEWGTMDGAAILGSDGCILTYSYGVAWVPVQIIARGSTKTFNIPKTLVDTIIKAKGKFRYLYTDIFNDSTLEMSVNTRMEQAQQDPYDDLPSDPKELQHLRTRTWAELLNRTYANNKTISLLELDPSTAQTSQLNYACRPWILQEMLEGGNNSIIPNAMRPLATLVQDKWLLVMMGTYVRLGSLNPHSDEISLRIPIISADLGETGEQQAALAKEALTVGGGNPLKAHEHYRQKAVVSCPKYDQAQDILLNFFLHPSA